MINQPRAGLGTFANIMAFAGLLLALVAASPAGAHHRHYGRARVHGWGAGMSLTDPDKDAALVVDGATGKALYSRNAGLERHPASLTKMMTLYLLFDSLKQGKMTMTSQLPISQHAAEQKPTNLHLWAGDQIAVETAIKAIVIRSANDVAVAIAEGLGGTESHFAEMMTAKAREFGMRSTYFHNASGLPDNLQITTAADLAILAHHLAYDFPQYFHFFATPAFTYRGVTYPTHDNLIGRYDGADGIKTGYTGASGFNLVSSVVRGGVHVIGVVMGGRTAHMRDREMVNLLDTAFGQIARNPTMVARSQVPWHGGSQTTAVASINADNSVSSPENNGPAVALLAPQPNYPSATDDEESAEAHTNDGNADLARSMGAPQPSVPPQAPIVQALPPPVVAQQPAPQQPVRMAMVAPPPARVAANIPSIRPRRKPAEFQQAAPLREPIIIAANHPPVPTPKPVLRTEIGEGDISFDRVGSTVAAVRGHDWTIQIGAFADQTLARAQLAAYAEKSMDVLGQAARIVVPFQGVDGHMLFRARFGPFPEREAREVCSKLTQRGQTCFAAVATR